MNDDLMSVSDCLARLPIRMSRRALIHHIKGGGLDSYQEWRRQIFLTPEQWAFHVSRIKPCSNSSGGGRKVSSTSSVPSAENITERVQRQLQSLILSQLRPARTRSPGLHAADRHLPASGESQDVRDALLPAAFQRPEKPPRKIIQFARDDFLPKLLPKCRGRLQGAVLLVSFTGARASECCRLADAYIDWERHEATLCETKNGDPRVVPLAGIVYEALHKLRGREGPIFGYKQRFSLNQALERACRRAGLPAMTSHKIGRHAFAGRLLAQGQTLKQVQETRGWRTYRMVAEIYGHLEKSSVRDAMRVSDTVLAQLIEPKIL
jgi:integrase